MKELKFMRNLDFGYVRTNDRSKTAEIKLSYKNSIDVPTLLIGGSLMALGAAVIVCGAYAKGADDYCEAEYQALKKCGIIE